MIRLEKLQLAAPGDDENPLLIAMYWKDILDKHIDDVIGCSVKSFNKQSSAAVKIVRKCSSHSDDVSKKTAIAQVTGGAAGAVGGVLFVTGLALIPFTFGGSVALSVAGGALGVANAGAQVAANALKKSSHESDIKFVNDATTNVIDFIEVFDKFLETCSHAFDKVKQYMETEEGREFVSLIQRISSNSDHVDPRSVEQFLNFNVATKSMLQIVRFIREGNYAGFHTRSIGRKPRLTTSSTGSGDLSVALRSSLPTLGLLNIASGARTIQSGSEMSKKMEKFASDLETATKELLTIYTELTHQHN